MLRAAWVVAALFLTTTIVGIGLQAQALKATILGRVTDTSGAAVTDARIAVRNLGANLTQAVTTDDKGRYTVPDLDVGTYEVDVDKTGFK